jgi:hypothetical protein
MDIAGGCHRSGTRGKRREVKHILDVPDRLAQDLPIADVPDNHLQTPSASRRPTAALVALGSVVQIDERAGGQVVEYSHCGSVAQKLVDEVRAKEASTASDEYGSHVCILRE